MFHDYGDYPYTAFVEGTAGHSGPVSDGCEISVQMMNYDYVNSMAVAKVGADADDTFTVLEIQTYVT